MGVGLSEAGGDVALEERVGLMGGGMLSDKGRDIGHERIGGWKWLQVSVMGTRTHVGRLGPWFEMFVFKNLSFACVLFASNNINSLQISQSLCH